MSIGPTSSVAATPQSVNPEVSDVDLMGALSVLGRELDLRFAAASGAPRHGALAERVAAVAHASSVRTRTVRLVEDWWREDHGPLLVVRIHAGAAQPLIVVPVRGGGYDWLAPRDGRRHRLTPAERSQLSPEAICFYRPLPPEVRTVGGLLMFGLSAFRRDLWSAAGVALAATAVAAGVPLVGKVIVDTAVPQADVGLVAQLALLLVALNVGQILFQVAEQFAALRFMLNASSALQSAVWDRLLRLPTAFFRRYTSGELLNRAMMITQVSEALGASLLRSLLTLLLVVVQLAVLFWFSWRLALVVLPVVLLLAAATAAVAWRLQRRSTALERHRGLALGFVVQLVLGVAKLRAAGATGRAFTRWTDQYREQLAGVLAVRRLLDTQTVLKALTPSLMIVLVYPCLAHFAGTQLGAAQGGGAALSFGALLGFTTALGMLNAGLAAVSTAAVDVLHGVAQHKLANPLLEAEPERREGAVAPGPLRGRVAIRDLSFRYDVQRPLALEAVSLTVEPGQFVGLVGLSGSGKSTLLRLLLGLDQPEAGRVLYDDRDLRGLDLTLVRRQIGAVLQTSQVIAGTLYDNIAAGRLASLEEVWQAAADADLADEIAALPMGLFTIVTERGANLSGGQRQRLLLARALVGNPRVLLLDEATSALDRPTQATIVRNLARRDVTRIVVAHRVDTLAAADRVYTLQDGRLVESTTRR